MNVEMQGSFKEEDCAAYGDYLTGVIPLMVWYVRTITVREEDPVPVSYALDMYVDIYRKTTLYKGESLPGKASWAGDPEWDIIKARIEDMIFNFEDQEKIESECWRLLEPVLDHTPKPENWFNCHNEDRPFGCWTCGVRDQNVWLHIANVYRPESPFDRAHYNMFAKDLLRMLEHAKKVHPEAADASCGTWLNSFPPFQKLLPSAWHESAVIHRESDSGYGTWGQYMDRRGGFNTRCGDMLRATGRHPFQRRACRCRIEEIIEHLETWDAGEDR